jgi:methyl-accepting chemotaxis protein
VISGLYEDKNMQTKHGKDFIQKLKDEVQKSNDRFKRIATTHPTDSTKPVSGKKDKAKQNESGSERKPSRKSLQAMSKGAEMSTLVQNIQTGSTPLRSTLSAKARARKTKVASASNKSSPSNPVSAAKQTSSAAKQTSSAAKQTSSAAKQTSSAAKQTSSAAKQTSSATKTALATKQTGSAKESSDAKQSSQRQTEPKVAAFSKNVGP